MLVPQRFALHFCRMKKELKIRQQDSYDCGAASLLSVGVWWGVKVPLSQVRRECGCTPEGISIEGIIDGAKSLGLEAKALKSNNLTPEGKKENLIELAKYSYPVIAHITQDDGFLHFVVIYKVSEQFVTLMDPAAGDEVKERIDDFAKKWNGYLILVSPGPSFKKYKTGETPWQWIKRYIKDYKRELCIALAVSLALSALGVANSLIMQIIIDKIIPSGNLHFLFGFSSLLMLLLPVSLFLGYARNLFLLKNGIKLETNIITSFLQKIFRLPPQFFQEWSSGDLQSRLSDTSKIGSLISEELVGMAVNIFCFILVIVLMFLFYSRLALYSMMFIPVYAGLYIWANKINKRYKRELAKGYAKFESNVIESFEGAESVKHHLGSQADLLYSESFASLVKTRYKSSKVFSWFGVLNNTAGSTFLTLIIIIGSFAIINGKMSVGEMVAFYTLSSFFILPMSSVIDFNSRKNEALVATERVSDIMEIPPEKSGKNIMVVRDENNLVIENLSFKYQGCDELLKGINYMFKRGNIYLIAGPNGCGKSTFGKLILRDLYPKSGSVLWGGANINSYDIESWRSFTGIVPQKLHLFNTTILNNITSFEKNPDIDKVALICRKLGLENTLEKLPGGILSSAGKGGCSLSGGETQRVAIARMLYKDPEICIFDEASSNIDKESEALITSVIEGLKKAGKIVLLISHKESAMEIADETLKLS